MNDAAPAKAVSTRRRRDTRIPIILAAGRGAGTPPGPPGSVNARLPVRKIDAAEQQEPPEYCRDGAAECGIVRNPGEAVLDAIAHVRDRCAWPPPQLEIGHQLTFACNQIKHAIGGRRDANDVALKVEC